MIALPPPIADFEAYRQRRNKRLAEEEYAEYRRRYDERLASESRCEPITVRPREFQPSAVTRPLGEGLAKLEAAMDEMCARPRVEDFDGPAAA